MPIYEVTTQLRISFQTSFQYYSQPPNSTPSFIYVFKCSSPYISSIFLSVLLSILTTICSMCEEDISDSSCIFQLWFLLYGNHCNLNKILGPLTVSCMSMFSTTLRYTIIFLKTYNLASLISPSESMWLNNVRLPSTTLLQSLNMIKFLTFSSLFRNFFKYKTQFVHIVTFLHQLWQVLLSQIQQ